MKKRFAAITLSVVLGMMTAVPASASDFLDDSEAFAIQSEETVIGDEWNPLQEFEDVSSDEEESVIEEAAPEVPDVQAGVVETPIGGEQETVQEETEDFVGEIDMSELPGTEEQKPEEETDEIVEEEFEEIPVMADLTAGWSERYVDGVVKYVHAKGSYDASGRPEYYTSADGLVTIGNQQYCFDENGYMVTGRVKMNDKYILLMPAERAVMNQGAAGTPNPCNSNLGQLQKAYWYWTGTAFQYYNGNGYFTSVADLRTAKLKNNTYTGYYRIDDCYFILKDNGVPRTGDYEVKEGIRQGLYYLYPAKNEKGYPGTMAINTWVNIKNSQGSRWRFYNKSGRTTLGIKATKLDKNIKSAVKDYTFLLTYGGYVYKKAALRKAADGYYYACNEKGIVQKDKLIRYKGERYYVNANGRRVSWTNSWHWIKSYGNRPYYFGSTPGKVSEQKGWVLITRGSFTNWYYFTANGNAAKAGWKKPYYFDENCALVTGLKTIDGKTYFFPLSDSQNHNGAMVKNKKFDYDGKTYYAGSDGVLVKKKWVTVGGNDYYFQADMTMAKNCYAKKGDKYGYLDSTGKFTVGWIVVDAAANKVRYVNTKAAGYVKNDYRVIEGVRYYFDGNGYRVSDLTSYYPTDWKNDPVLNKLHNGGYAPYYLECDKTNGVITVYTDSSKSIPVKTIRTSVGNPTTLTPSGTYPLTRSSRWQPLMGPSWGQYGTHVVNGIFIHSVACNAANSYNLPASAYDMLGSPASHGCMRVCVADAKWVYDNCSGGRITIFYGGYQAQECFKGPLGRKPLVPRYGAGNFDPTDPAI